MHYSVYCIVGLHFKTYPQNTGLDVEPEVSYATFPALCFKIPTIGAEAGTVTIARLSSIVVIN